MYTVRKLAIGTIAVILLGAAAQSRAQSPDDLALMQTFLGIMSDYYAIIEATYDVASDSEKSAILQMSKIQEVYEDRGEKVRSTVVLQDVLEKSNNQTIRNAAYMLLGDTLKESGRTDEALELLQKGLDENIKAAR